MALNAMFFTWFSLQFPTSFVVNTYSLLKRENIGLSLTFRNVILILDYRFVHL